MLCSSRKKSINPQKELEFPGSGDFCKIKHFKKCRKLKKDFLRGGESSVGDVWKCLELHIWKTHWFYIANHPRHYQSLWCRYVSMNFPWHHEFCFLFVDLLLVQFWLHQLLPTSILILWTEIQVRNNNTSRTCSVLQKPAGLQIDRPCKGHCAGQERDFLLIVPPYTQVYK